VSAAGLSVLLVDDEPPALDELRYLLDQLPGIEEVVTADAALPALKLLRDAHFDAAFLDISMPGLDGMELAGLLGRMHRPPAVVFVTASPSRAVDAYGVGALDYLLKPVRLERLAESVARIRRTRADLAPAADRSGDTEPAPTGDPGPAADLVAVPVEVAGRTRAVHRADVRYVEANGDYVRLHVADGSYLVRMPITTLEERWGPAGFVRVHRGFLVALRHVAELATDAGGGLAVRVAGREIPVSRRHVRAVKAAFAEAARRGQLGRKSRGAD